MAQSVDPTHREKAVLDAGVADRPATSHVAELVQQHRLEDHQNIDWKITNLMAIIMGERDFSAFALLVRRMDARRKVRSLIISEQTGCLGSE
jgi:hypothetical protein